MNCSFKKYTKEIATHYVGKTGNEYPIDEYKNWGRGEFERSRHDLPLDEYPYSIKYKVEYVWRICRECNCEDKKELN